MCERQSQLNPYFITGFCDGECSFRIGVEKLVGYSTGWKVQLVFQITLHEKDLKLLEQIKNYLAPAGIGHIYIKKGNNAVEYRVGSKKDFKVLIDHFEKYPLITQKLADYLL